MRPPRRKTQSKRKKKKLRPRRDRCRFCRDKVTAVNYKDADVLSKLITDHGRLFGRKRSGNCAKHQRMVEHAVARARFLALLPYT